MVFIKLPISLFFLLILNKKYQLRIWFSRNQISTSFQATNITNAIQTPRKPNSQLKTKILLYIYIYIYIYIKDINIFFVLIFVVLVVDDPHFDRIFKIVVICTKCLKWSSFSQFMFYLVIICDSV